MAFVRSISGIRATIGDSLTPKLISEYTAAFAETLPEGNIVVGRDGRPSGSWIENIVVGTLLAMNRNVLIAGITPTPTIQVLTEETKSAGGISITASHNPDNWNGMKFIKSDGTFLTYYENNKLFEIVDEGAYSFPQNTSTKIEHIANPYEHHINRIISIPLFKETNIANKIKDRKFKVVFDANNSSGSIIIPQLLEMLGCEVIKVNCNSNGIFAHPPEPKPENIREVVNLVTKYGADIGFVVDPDGDRLVFIDENGNPVWEELTIVIAINAVGEFLEYFYPKSNKVVVNYSTTQVAEYVARKYGLELLRAPVGEINVVNKMKEVDAIVGGEGSGGVILPHCHYGRDSLVGIALALSLLTKYNVPISELVASYPKVFMQKYQVEIKEDFDEIIEELVNSLGVSLLDVNTEDGYRFESDFGWVHIRKSNTEPIARIICEIQKEEDRDKICRLIKSIFEV
jgi:phosphomannomutase